MFDVFISIIQDAKCGYCEVVGESELGSLQEIRKRYYNSMLIGDIENEILDLTRCQFNDFSVFDVVTFAQNEKSYRSIDTAKSLAIVVGEPSAKQFAEEFSYLLQHEYKRIGIFENKFDAIDWLSSIQTLETWAISEVVVPK